MKKLTLLAFASVIAASIVSCKKEEEVVVPVVVKVTYADVKTIFTTRCTPCHLAGSAVNPNKWDDYATAKGKITNILDRIQRTAGSTGAMPRGATAQIPADEIAKLKQWEKDGLLEK